MVLYITLLSIAICAAYFAASVTLSRSAINRSMETSLEGITHQSSSLISERVNSYYERLSAVATNDLFWSAYISESRLFSLLKRVQADEGYLDLVYVDKNGIAYNSGGQKYPIGDDESYQEGMAGNRSVTDPTATGDGDKMAMTYSVPVVNSAGSVTGVLMQTSDGYELSNLISDVTYGDTGYSFVVNDEGVMVAHADRTMVAEQDRTLEKAKADPAQQELASLLTRMVSGETGIGEYTYKGVTKFSGFAPIEGTSWYMALTAPYSEVFAATEQLQWILLAAAALLALLSAGAALIIANRIHKPILAMSGVAAEFAVGNLDVDVDIRQRNEIGQLAQAFRTVSINMSGIIRNILTATTQVAEGSRQIADSGMMLAQGATQQASALEELSASVEQIASQTRLNAKNANEANELVGSARTLAERGNEKMGDMLRAMEDIDRASADINRIIKVIDDIAFQTNILALNAAVEAARAGQHGRGFAVVAEEVRNLAAKSASAAKETSSMIENSTRSVAGGTKLARETAEALERIVGEVGRVTSLVQGISTASGEQTTGIDQINQGLLQISQVVQANSSTSQQSAAASKELTAQAVALREQVAGFKLRNETADAPSAGDPAAIPPERPAVSAQAPSGKTRSAAPGKSAPAPEKSAAPIRKMSDAPIPASVREAASAAVSAAFGRPASVLLGQEHKPRRPVKISLGEEDRPARPAKISLGEEDEPSQPDRSAKIALSDREFGKY